VLLVALQVTGFEVALLHSTGHLKDVDLSKTALTEAALTRLCTVLSSITRFSLAWSKRISSVGLAQLAKLGSLVDLNLRECSGLLDESLLEIFTGRAVLTLF